MHGNMYMHSHIATDIHSTEQLINSYKNEKNNFRTIIIIKF